MTDEHERQDLDDEADDDGEPKITLDRYLSKRRTPKSGVSQIVAMVLMLITLVLVIMYKDRCGDMVSGVMGDIDPQEETRPSVRFKIQPGPSSTSPSSTSPSSQPAK